MARPHLQQTSRGPLRFRSLPLTGLFVLALFYTAYAARAVLLPLAMAILFAFLLRPVVRLLRRIRIPEPAGAALVLIVLLSLISYGISSLSGPARSWIEKAPESLAEIGRKLEGIISPVRRASRTAEELNRLTRPSERPVIVAPGPGLTQSVIAGAREFLAEGAVMLVLLFFILASGDLFPTKLQKLYRTPERRQQVADVVREVERSVSRYLLTVTLINAGEGLVVGAGMYLIGMPDPVLWGVMAALLVYVPYLGPLVGIAVVTVVALLNLSIETALLAPALYLAVEILQGQLLTPLILGARFRMNPVAIFVWLLLWVTIWGVVGAVIAVPLLAVFKIFCDRIEPLKPIAELVSD